MNGQLSFREAVSRLGGVYILGVAGDSGSGKTRFTQSIRHLLGDELVSTITLDDYHLLDREQRKERNITPLAPEANDLGGLEEDLAAMKRGIPIEKMVYNHSTGTLVGPVLFKPSKIVILEGLHTLYTETLRSLIDFSLYVDPADDVKKEWKLKRDMEKRGYTRHEVIEEIQKRQEDYDRYIAPQKEYADALIQIAFSRYGRDLGWQKNIYETTLSQIPISDELPGADLALNLPALMTLVPGQFSLHYSRKDYGGKTMASLTFDGEFDCHFILGLRDLFSGEAGVSPCQILGEQEMLTAPDIVRALLAWRIIQEIILEG
ncbi:MAG: phosphoribulokinase [Methanoregulaceae archaeon]|jgi:phosphoribulokinase|nr:phosphoribulokinase [Methanoregulaceae archaeon]